MPNTEEAFQSKQFSLNDVIKGLSSLFSQGVQGGQAAVSEIPKAVGETNLATGQEAGPMSMGASAAAPFVTQVAQALQKGYLKAAQESGVNAKNAGVSPQVIQDTTEPLITGQQAFAATMPQAQPNQQPQMQPSNIDVNVVKQIQQAAQVQQPNAGDYLLGTLFGIRTPKVQGAYSQAEAAGRVGPEVTAKYMSEQLPLSTAQAVQIPAGIAEKQAELVNTARGQMIDMARISAPFAFPGLKYFGARPEEYKQATGNIEGLNRSFQKPITELQQTRERLSSRGKQTLQNLPHVSQAPKGAKGWDTEKGRWVF